MFCPRCYFNAQNGEQECPLCGTPLQPVPADYAGHPSYVPPVRKEPEMVIGAVRRCVSSAGFLTAAIAFTLSVVLCFVGVAQAGKAVNVFLSDVLNAVSGAQNVPVYLEETTADWIALIAAVPGGVIGTIQAVSLWCVYAAAKKRQTADMSVGGLMELKLMNTVVLSCVCAGGMLSALILLTDVLMAFQTDMLTGMLMLFLTFTAGGIYGLWIAFYVKVRQTLNTVMHTARTGIPSDAVSAFVTVMCFVYAAAAVLTAIPLGVWLNPWITAAALARGVSCAAFGGLLLQYRNRMLLFTYTPPVAGTGVYTIPETPPVSVYTANPPSVREERYPPDGGSMTP